MAKTAEDYCKAIDRYLLPREHPDHIDEQAMNTILSSHRFNFAATKPQGNPCTPAHTDLTTFNQGGRSRLA